jgi:phosphoribosylglycinamide formyltransferase-1
MRKLPGKTMIAFAQDMLRELHPHQGSWIVLASYRRLIAPTLHEVYRGRIVNVHPALLPTFPGKDAIGPRCARASR